LERPPAEEYLLESIFCQKRENNEKSIDIYDHDGLCFLITAMAFAQDDYKTIFILQILWHGIDSSLLT